MEFESVGQKLKILTPVRKNRYLYAKAVVARGVKRTFESRLRPVAVYLSLASLCRTLCRL